MAAIDVDVAPVVASTEEARSLPGADTPRHYPRTAGAGGVAAPPKVRHCQTSGSRRGRDRSAVPHGLPVGSVSVRGHCPDSCPASTPSSTSPNAPPTDIPFDARGACTGACGGGSARRGVGEGDEG